MCKRKKTYAAGDVTIVSSSEEEQDLSGSFVVENADEYDEEYLDMIFGSQEKDC